MITLGSLIRSRNNSLGIGKVINISDTQASVEYFYSVGQRIEKSLPLSSLYQFKLERQTRCCIYLESQEAWINGRIYEWDEEAHKYRIDLPDKKTIAVDEEQVYVRCNLPQADPIETLAMKGQETPYFHDRRFAFVKCLILQRAVSRGMTGLISANIKLYPHQVEVVRRVLEDPIQRYLLADEVGLGKTIEAGAILRQYLLDEPSGRAVVLVPQYLLQQWQQELENNGIIHRLFIHILGYHDQVEIVEERRQFCLEDLPLDVLNLQKAGKQAQDFYAFLIGNDNIQKATVNWLNQHLDEAITQMLNLGREDLLRLMREVREYLAEQNVELVLLIEDFAKLQGIDREVLEAVLAKPQQPGSKPLCAIRTALACTIGYFEGLIKTFDTVQQRVTFSVYLDVGTVSNHSLITQADIQEFVSRYLNTVRLEDRVILDWANNNNQEGGFQGEPLKSACSECEHREACHTGFGSINDIGLYPFTPKALEQMFIRVSTNNFNPRILIKDVLKYVL